MNMPVNEKEAKPLEVDQERMKVKSRIRKMYLGTILMVLGSFLILIDTY